MREVIKHSNAWWVCNSWASSYLGECQFLVSSRVKSKAEVGVHEDSACKSPHLLHVKAFCCLNTPCAGIKCWMSAPQSLISIESWHRALVVTILNGRKGMDVILGGSSGGEKWRREMGVKGGSDRSEVVLSSCLRQLEEFRIRNSQCGREDAPGNILWYPPFPFSATCWSFHSNANDVGNICSFLPPPFPLLSSPFPPTGCRKGKGEHRWETMEVDYEENVLIPHWENAPHTNQKTQNDEGGEAKDTRPLRYWEIDRLREQAHHWLTRSPSTWNSLFFI